MFTQNIAVAIKEKPATANSEAKVRARLVMADLASSGGVIDTFVATVDGNSTRMMAQWSVQDDNFFLDSDDCSDAYYAGTPYPMSDPRGRILLGRIVGGWEEFGYPQYNERGEKLCAQLLKNMPGRREAGKIFGDFYRNKLLGWNFKEGIVDRRVFYKLTPGPLPRRMGVLLGVHVDDNLCLVADRQVYAEFKAQWSKVFKSSQTAKNPALVSFAGLNFRRIDGSTISIGGGEEIMDSLETALDAAQSFGTWPAALHDDVPMAADALPKLRAPAPEGEHPAESAHHSLARTLLGICGWATGQWRPEAWFAFIAISQQISTNFTRAVWRCLVQACSYLRRTRHYRLTFRRALPPGGGGRAPQTRPRGSCGSWPPIPPRSTQDLGASAAAARSVSAPERRLAGA